MNNDHENNGVPVLVSIVPDLVEGTGHVYDYHQSVGKAANLIGYKHLVATAPDAIVKTLPTNWNACLNSDKLEWEIPTILKVFRVKSIYDWAICLTTYLRQDTISNSDHVVLFLERFVVSHLLAIILTLILIPRNNLSVWLLYRRDVHNQKNRSIYKILNILIKSILPAKKFQLITDSELLSKSLCNYFDMSVNVLPIPHTEIIDNNDNLSKPTNKIICWWVGSPREEKGLNIIKSLASEVCKSANQIHLLMAKSSRIGAVSGGVTIELIQDTLTRLEYLQWLSNCDICLMPYNTFDYRERTSGVFVECVIAGKIPLVTSNTWMASELSKYKLEELIINWEYPNIVMEKIIKYNQDSHIREKLELMQRQYKSLHSLQGYANKMQMIFENNL